ncbi:MAG: hypothetical protein JSU58_05665 [Dehalococcoidales bacterium]|nr:MAG: hypothetical protein JSU58_05665 [Dehalococcoidales bacterium]
MKLRLILITVTSILILITAMILGCSFDKRLEVAEGDYIPVFIETRGHDNSGINQIVSMTVDRGEEIIKIRLTDGSSINAPFSAIPEQEWPSGCPASIGSSRMEVLDIDPDELTFGTIAIRNPVVVRNCPQNPEILILREDGLIEGSGTACAGDIMCLHFKPVVASNGD